MNTRLVVSVALAVGGAVALLFDHVLPPAQAQTSAAGQSLDLKMLKLEARVDALQQRCNALQAQVNQLKANKAIIMGDHIAPYYHPQPDLPQPGPRRSNIPPSQITLLGQPVH